MAAYFCPHCKARTTFQDLGPGVWWDGDRHDLWQCNDCAGIVYSRFAGGEEDVRMYPTVRSEAPAEYPDDVRENFSEALRSLNVNNPKAAVVMVRSALQAATRELGANGNTLREEVDDLATKHIIPSSLQDWAHELRSGGNLVAHPKPDETVDAADAEELVALAESIFEYIYIVPAEVAARRERLSAAADATPEVQPNI